MQNLNTRLITKEEEFEHLFSVCTLVSRKDEYAGMVNSFIDKGFITAICEYLYIDNSVTNTFDAYAGINRFLREARGKYLVVCHQDILLNYDGADDLINCINEVEEADPDWAVLGNAGGVNLKHLSLYVMQNEVSMFYETNFPLKTMSLDENFMVIKRSANLSLSHNLSGFHLYGTDLCLIADILGYNAYIIKFRLLHKSLGNADSSFFEVERRLKKKYTEALRPRFLRTPFTRFYLSGNRFKNFVNNTAPILFLARKYYQLFRPVKGYVLKLNKRVK